MNKRGAGGEGHGAAGGASAAGRRDRDGDGGGGEGEGKLRIHLKRSCTDRKVVPGNTKLGLTTDDWHKFKKLLASKTFAVHDTQRMRGEDLTAKWATESGFREPVIAVDKTGMGLKVPEPSFTVADVARVVGEDKAIRPIHVGEQANIDQSMTLAEFAEYFETCTKPGQAILNMISLEFSDTPLSKMVRSPQVVRDIDWLNQCWPDDRKQEGQFPKVQYYCLMSQGGAYTDFHVDFGGTSVWYHILRGKKEFLLIRPTRANLDLYEGWINSPTQSQVFFGDLADVCYRVVLNAGETLMIPSGWIHAVFTPKPSLVFGGNFLHSLNIPMQLQIHSIEVRAKIHNKFRFPYLKEMMFFAASRYLRALQEQQGVAKTTPSGKKELPAGGWKGPKAKGRGREGEEAGRKAGTSASTAAAVGDAEHAASNSGSLNRWEREGLQPLLEACLGWMKEEDEDSSEEDVPDEWYAAAMAAGCAEVEEMLTELGLRISTLDKMPLAGEAPTASTSSSSSAAAAALTAPARKAAVAGLNSVPTTDNVVADAGAPDVSSAEDSDADDGPRPVAVAAPAPDTDADGIIATAAPPPLPPPLPPTLLAPPQMPAMPAMPTMPAMPALVVSPEASGSNAVAAAGARSARARGGESGGGFGAAPVPAAGGPAGPVVPPRSLPKLKISIKPRSPRPPEASDTGKVVTPSGRKSPGGGVSPRASLKLVLKGPALSSRSPGKGAGGSEGFGGGGGGGGGGGVAGRREGGVVRVASSSPTGRKRVRGRQVWDRRWEEGGRGGEASRRRGSSGGEEDEEEDEEDEEEEEEEEDEEEDEEEEEDDSDGEGRVGRGGKRKARPLGSRLRAIARLGDDAAAGNSEDDDSADEYKPDAEDGVLPGDHKFNLDDDDVRETKKTRATTADISQRSTGSGFGGAARGGSAWSGFGGGRGGASGGGEGEPLRRRAVVGGMRRIPGTKQQALRKNGVFKIAPQSKVLKKEKKPLTAKQKLLAKMRR